MPRLKLSPTHFPLENYPYDFSPCHRRILSARKISPEQLNKSLTKLIDVSQLSGASKAARRIYNAIENKEQIVIVGDYDADGATATAIMLLVLRHLKANVDNIIPKRINMGYGLSEKAVKQIMVKKAQLVITVDNGISANESVSKLIDKGIDVIITDHHLPPQILPNATVIVNPNCKNCSFPSKYLAGVGVAFYVMLALRQTYRQQNNTNLNNFCMPDLLPFVAIGTVADMVPLDFNNRILVEQGLRRIRASHCTAGILSLINIASLSVKQLNTIEIAFHIAPRLNAAGRIADMQLGVDCLLSNNQRLAQDYAIELDRLNRERKAIENEMRAKADILLKPSYQTTAPVICLYDKSWNEGIIGIVAAKIKDKYNKTTFIFTQAKDKLHLKASARASKEVNLIDALNCLNKDYPKLLVAYGGHAKAAGLTLTTHNYKKFTAAITRILSKQILNTNIDNIIYTDGELLPYELSIDNALFLKTLETWGSNISEPLFENNFYISHIKEVGKNHAQMQVIEENSGLNFKAIAFDKYEYYANLAKQHCRIAYRLSVNKWHKRQYLTLLVNYIQH